MIQIRKFNYYMLNESDIQQVRNIISEFFKKTGLEIDLNISCSNDKTISVNLNSEEPKILIGQNGQTLVDIQHLLKAVLSRKIEDQFYIDLDINNYKERKIAYLKESARDWANEASLGGKEKSLDPMPSFERRIVHLELAGRSDVKTESAGQGLDRHIVIKPILQS